jgi:uncharacterized protein YqhQ
MQRIVSGAATPQSITLDTEKYSYTGIFNNPNIQIKERKTNSKEKLYLKNNKFVKLPIIRSICFLMSFYPISSLILLLIAEVFLHLHNSQLHITNNIVYALFVMVIIFSVIVIIRIILTRKNHGTEHKVYNTSQVDANMTLQDIKSFQTFVPNCGTTYFVNSIIIEIVVFVLLHSVILGLILGAEFDYLVSNRDNKLQRFLQKLTTTQPDDKNIELAIRIVKVIQLNEG